MTPCTEVPELQLEALKKLVQRFTEKTITLQHGGMIQSGDGSLAL